jgi:hypothetical protein
MRSVQHTFRLFAQCGVPAHAVNLDAIVYWLEKGETPQQIVERSGAKPLCAACVKES